MEKRHASDEEIENTRNEMDKIIGNISKNLKKELKKIKRKILKDNLTKKM